LRLKDQDVHGVDVEPLFRLRERDPAAVEQLTVRLLEDLREAGERLNQNPDNSTRPLSSRAARP
jgi:hypothetical protein